MVETLLEIAGWISENGRGDKQTVYFKEQLEDIAYFLEMILQNDMGTVQSDE